MISHYPNRMPPVFAGRNRPAAPGIALTLAIMAAGPAQVTATVAVDLADLSIEELANIEITSVSKRAEPLTDAAASVFVIARDDIRRSGARSLPEALRLAPNLQVARVHSGYAISARGFNNSAGNKLLVLIDGRPVYSPLFSGVFWDVQNVLMEDVERIEVISGPGGTLWGTNAVNGVINIITRSAADTQGGLVAAGTGNDETGGAVRYGGTLGTEAHYRVYGRYFDREHTHTADGTARDDAWDLGQAGFRADWDGARDQVTMQANAYRGTEGQPAPGTIVTGAVFELGDTTVAGTNLTARWDHLLDSGSDLMLQAYYDRTERTVPPTFAEVLDVFEVQFQHSLRPIGIHTLTWGAEYRHAQDDVTNSQYIAFLPARANLDWASLFAQDEVSLLDNLRLTAGARIESNDYTNTEFLPSARLAWKPASDHMLWTAVSRAVRAPSRLDHDTFVPGTPPYVLAGGPDVRSEIATVYELGYRGQPLPSTSCSVTVFRADYDHLRSQEVDFSVPLVLYANQAEGETRGIEMWGAHQATDNWRLSAGLSVLDTDLRLKPGSTDPFGTRVLGNDPDYQWLLRSTLDLTPNHEFDFMVRHVDELPEPVVPAYTSMDARLGWQINRHTELSLTLQNLLDESHAEFGNESTRGEYGRSVYAQLLWRQ